MSHRLKMTRVSLKMVIRNSHSYSRWFWWQCAGRPKRFVFTFPSGVPQCATDLKLQRVPCRRLSVRQRGADETAYPKVPGANPGAVERYPATSGHAVLRTGGRRDHRRAGQALPVPLALHVRDRTFLRLPRGDKIFMSAENHYC